LLIFVLEKEIQMKGTEPFPSSFSMTQETSISAIEALIEQLLQENQDIFLVSVKIKPTNNIKIFLDADSGLSIEKCIKINRALYKIIEERQWYPDGNFSLEVSSPGVDEPLKLLRQYKKNIGRNVEVTLNNDTKQEGKLIEVVEESIKLEQQEGKGKKAVTKFIDIAFNEIKQTKILISF
jgi:ribosome maturation factor RimP